MDLKNVISSFISQLNNILKITPNNITPIIPDQSTADPDVHQTIIFKTATD